MSSMEPGARKATSGVEDTTDSSGGPVAKRVKKKVVKHGGLGEMTKASNRPLPTEFGDGTYRVVINRPSLLQDIASITLSGYKTLIEIVKAKLTGQVFQDDKTMIMERLIQLVSGFSTNSKTQETLTVSFVEQLWDTLDHPPRLYMGDQYRFRQADGSNNNPFYPRLGAAGTSYARTCPPRVLPLGSLPDPEIVFEGVMARDSFTKNANNVSSVLFHWATLVIHDIFWTSQEDSNVNNASSYVDLAPLYGHNQEMQNSVRTFKDGKLKPDAFADKRLLGMPPGVCVLLVMFNRFHNRIATDLAAINENHRFDKPSPSLTGDAATAAWKKYDEEIFQTARLITNGLYVNCVLIDYVRNILNLNRLDTEWTLDPRILPNDPKKGRERGQGNSISAEFNVVYRWHSCLSEMDEDWMDQHLSRTVGEDYAQMDGRTLVMAMKRWAMSLPKDPAEFTFGGFQRGADGRFDDDDLVNCLATATEQPAGSFGARNVPRVMKAIEVLGILQCRKWKLAGLNEFRMHFGLKAYETFEDINSDPTVADALRNLYQHPDYVELYPGLVAEEAKKPMVPGVGTTTSYTISRAILSDAVSLVLGDRHLTTDFTPLNLTNWGYKEADRDPKVNHGCCLYKLFIGAFPDHYKADSVYAHYPMVTPPENKRILTALDRADRFSFDRPRFQGPRVEITSYDGAKHVLDSEAAYRVPWRETMGYLSGRRDGRVMEATDRKTMEQLLYQDHWRPVVKDFYERTAEALLSRKSYRIGGSSYVDAIRDVGNAAQTHFAAEVFNISLKTEDNPKGVFTEHELYATLAAIHMCLFEDDDPSKSFALRQKTKEAADVLGSSLITSTKYLTSFGTHLFSSKAKGDVLATWGADMLKGLIKGGMTPFDAVWGLVLPTAAGMVAPQGKLFALALDYYLSPSGQQHLPKIQHLAAQEASGETDALLLGYVMEGIRIAGGGSTLETVAAETDTIVEEDGRRVNVNKGDKVLLSFAAAAKDGAHFPNPDEVDPTRPLDAYMPFCAGTHTALGKEVCQVGLVELFRAVFRRKNLRRAAGAPGELKRVAREGGRDMFLIEDWSALTPFPMSMKVAWD